MDNLALINKIEASRYIDGKQKNRLIELAEKCSGKEGCAPKLMSQEASNILDSAFSDGNELRIPKELFDDAVGKFMLKMRLGLLNSRRLFSHRDVSVIAGISKQNFGKLVSGGNLVGIKVGKMTVYEEHEVIEFMNGRLAYKRFSDREITARIEAFVYMKDEGFSVDDIEDKFKAISEKRSVKDIENGTVEKQIFQFEDIYM